MLAETANMAEVMKPGYTETDKMLQRWTDYISYAGTFGVDVKSQSVIHHVDISLFPNNVGHDQVRAFVFGKEEETGTDTLQLSATFPLQNQVKVNCACSFVHVFVHVDLHAQNYMHN